MLNPPEDEADNSAGARQIALVPNDELFESYQWNLRQIRAPEAWDLTTGLAGTIIAVLDTGVSLTHPDLLSKLVSGYDFVNDDAVPEDDHGNGTHVAGVAAAETNNAIGIAGTVWNARIMPVKVLDSNARGDAARAARGVIFAADRGAKIINLDLVGTTSSSALQDAIDYAYARGALVIAPVGNDGTSELSYPAANRHVLAVGATDRADRRLSTSNTGDYISVVAPGDSIGSTYRPPGGSNGYAVASTTAQAAAHVAGLAALLLAINPTLGPDDIRTLIESSADDVGVPGRDPETGHGRINAFRAVQLAAPGNVNSRGAGSYVVQPAPRNMLFFPLVKKESNGWSTSFTVLNTARTATNMQVDIIDSSGRVAHTITPTLAANASITFEPTRMFELGRGFVGSAVVRSDTPIAGIANEDRLGRDRMSYEALSGGAATVWLPLLTRDFGGWSSGVQVQNIGTGPGEVRVSLYTRGSTAGPIVRQLSIPSGASRTVYLPAEDRLPSEWVGSAVIESTNGEPLAAIVNQVHMGGGGMSYVGVAQPSTPLYAPLLFRNAGGWNTGLQVQNAGTSSASLSATYTRTNGEGGPWSESLMAAPGGSATFYQPANADLPDDFVGAGIVRAAGGQPLSGIVNEVRYEGNMAMAYGAPGVGAPTMYVPLLYRGYGGWNSGAQIHNLGATPTVATITFYAQDGASITSMQQTIEAEEAVTVYLPAILDLPRSFLGTAVISSGNGNGLAVVVNHVKL